KRVVDVHLMRGVAGVATYTADLAMEVVQAKRVSVTIRGLPDGRRRRARVEGAPLANGGDAILRIARIGRFAEPAITRPYLFFLQVFDGGGQRATLASDAQYEVVVLLATVALRVLADVG